MEGKGEWYDKDYCEIISLYAKIKLDITTINGLKDVVNKLKLEADSESAKKTSIESNPVELNSDKKNELLESVN